MTLLACAALSNVCLAQVNPFPKAHDMLQQATQITQGSRAGNPSSNGGGGGQSSSGSGSGSATSGSSSSSASSAPVSPETALVRSAGYGNLAEVQKKVEAGASLDTRDGSGNTMLHAASAKGKLDVVAYLLGRPGIDLNATNKAGSTPLMEAASAGNTDVVKALLEKGADLNLKNGEGQTALHRAAATGRLQSVRALLSAGADPAAVDAKGNTPAALAQRYRQAEWQGVQQELAAAALKRQ